MTDERPERRRRGFSGAPAGNGCGDQHRQQTERDRGDGCERRQGRADGRRCEHEHRDIACDDGDAEQRLGDPGPIPEEDLRHRGLHSGEPRLRAAWRERECQQKHKGEACDGERKTGEKMAQIFRDHRSTQKRPQHDAESGDEEKDTLPGDPLEEHRLRRYLPAPFAFSPVTDGAYRIPSHAAGQKLVEQGSKIVVADCLADAQMLAKPRGGIAPAERGENDLNLHQKKPGDHITRFGRDEARGDPFGIEAQDHGNEKCEGCR